MYIYFWKRFKFKQSYKRSRDNSFPIKINLIIANKANAGVKLRKKFSIPFIIIDTSKKNYEIKILNGSQKKYFDNMSSGYMKIIKRFIRQFKRPILNIHPSLLPKFKGINTYKRIIEKELLAARFICKWYLTLEK